MLHYLVVAHQTTTSTELLQCLSELADFDPETVFTVLVPATPVVHLLAWKEGETNEIARQRAEEARERFVDSGLNVPQAKVGDGSPLIAIGDELRAHPGEYDAVVLSTLPPGVSRWLRLDLQNLVERQFGLPVIHVVAKLDTSHVRNIVVALGGQTGGGARLLGPAIAQALGANYVDRLILQAAAQHLGASVTALHQKEERLPTKGERFRRFLQTAIGHSAPTDEVPAFLTEEYESPVITRGLDLEDAKYIKGLQVVFQDLAARGNVVIVGRGSPIILREVPNVLKVGLVANRRDCVARIMEREQLTHGEAEKAVIERDKARAYYFKRFFGADDPDNPEFYHLVINTSDVPVDYAVDLVVQSAKALEEGRLRTVDASA